MDRLLGVKVNVTTILDNSVSGRVYSYCPVTNTLTLIEDGPEVSTPNYRILKLSFIRDISVTDKKSSVALSFGTSGQETFLKAEPRIGSVSIRDAVRRETAAVQNAREVRYVKGVGVSQEGQHIFRALYKT
jgi:protein LSM12